MAFGMQAGGGIMDLPLTPLVGYEDWAEMTAMHPSHPLVGGSAGQPGYGSISTRRVAIADPATSATLGAGSGAAPSAHWKEVFNLKGNPIGWVLIAAILYLGLAHIHLRAGASGGFGLGGR